MPSILDKQNGRRYGQVQFVNEVVDFVTTAEGRRLRIPRQAEQSFHAKPNTDSRASRTPIPRQAEQFVSPAWNL